MEDTWKVKVARLRVSAIPPYGSGFTAVAGHAGHERLHCEIPPCACSQMIDRSHHSILVVDDNPSARYATARTLRAAGFNTVEAAAGAEALELAEFVSAAVLDVHLPDLLGFEVCRLLRQRAATASLPVVHVSAVFVSQAEQRAGMEAGANAYMVAPFDPEALVTTLDHLIETGPLATRQQPAG